MTKIKQAHNAAPDVRRLHVPVLFMPLIVNSDYLIPVFFRTCSVKELKII